MGLPHLRTEGADAPDLVPTDPMRSAVEDRLQAFFDAKRSRIGALAPEGLAMLDAVADLTLRGGKRVRPVLLGAAFRSVAPDRTLEDVIDAAASLELLQTYLLVHDDWMDGDAVRRGGRAVHTVFTERHGAATGAALAILSGNLASAFAWELLLSSARASRGADAAVEVFHRMHREVVVGQQLDLLGSADVSRMHRLKTGSYTVRGPLDLGAVLGDATEGKRAALAAFGAPLGEAFQLRDDLLGVFGDPAKTGKPAGDLRAGRHTSLLASVGVLPESDRRVLSAARHADAGPAALADARDVLERSGARKRVESRLETLLQQAVDALDGAPLSAAGIDQLVRLASRLAVRST